jgi:hypothetical protein
MSIVVCTENLRVLLPNLLHCLFGAPKASSAHALCEPVSRYPSTLKAQFFPEGDLCPEDWTARCRKLLEETQDGQCDRD